MCMHKCKGLLIGTKSCVAPSYKYFQISLKVTTLPLYIAKSDGVSTEFDKLAWWKSHQHELPNWSKAGNTALLNEPSSTAAERVFSLLNNSFKENQARAF